MFDPMQMKAMVIEGLIESVEGGDVESAEVLGHTLGVGVRFMDLEKKGIDALTKALESDNQALQEAAKAALEEIKARIG